MCGGAYWNVCGERVYGMPDRKRVGVHPGTYEYTLTACLLGEGSVHLRGLNSGLNCCASDMNLPVSPQGRFEKQGVLGR